MWNFGSVNATLVAPVYVLGTRSDNGTSLRLPARSLWSRSGWARWFRVVGDSSASRVRLPRPSEE